MLASIIRFNRYELVTLLPHASIRQILFAKKWVRVRIVRPMEIRPSVPTTNEIRGPETEVEMPPFSKGLRPRASPAFAQVLAR